MNCRYNSNVFPFCCSFRTNFLRFDWVEANSVLTDPFYPFVIVTDQIRYTNSKSKYFMVLIKLVEFGQGD